MRTKLNRSNVEDILSLTSMQEGMLFHYEMNPDSSEYHEQVSIDFVGDIDLNLLQKAWDFVIEQNEMLRTVFRWKGIDKPVQAILKSRRVVVRSYDLSGKKGAEKESALEDIKQADLRNRIDIETETLRLTLCKHKMHEYTMIISNHHILYDGWSSAIIIKELMSAYRLLYEGLELKVLSKNKFREYIKWIQSQDKIKQKAYWESYLDGAEQSDNLFSSVVLPETKNYICALSHDLSDKIEESARENGVSVASLLYCVWGILVQKLNNSRDVMFGTTVSGRSHSIKDVENMVGLFINTLPLRVQTDEKETLIQLMKKIDKAAKERDEFESTSLVDIIEYGKMHSKSQLFHSLVVIENYPLNVKDYQHEILSISEYSAIERTNYNLTLGITILDSVELNFRYNCFADDGMMKRIGQYFEVIASAIVDDKNRKVTDIDILSEAERNQLLYEFNDTYVKYPREKTIHQLFEEQVERTPKNIALIFNNESMTYDELNAKSNQLARILRDKGVRSDSIVGLMVERSFEMIIGILGILKAGGAYLPVDPEYPVERIEFMLKDSRADILLTQSCLFEKVYHKSETINLDELLNFGSKLESLENLKSLNSSDDLAYVIFTSGSTGKPKGVMVEHKSIVNTLLWRMKYYRFNDRDIVLQIPAFTFDSSVEDIFTTLISGSSLVLINQGRRFDLNYLKNTIYENKVTNFLITPALYSGLLDNGVCDVESLRIVTVAGESLHVSVLEKHFKSFKNVKIVNEYGPTECSVCSTVYEIINKNSKVLIGKPIDNISVYILGKNDSLSPIGILGELCISGEGLTRGYLKRPELTAEKFVPNPFIPGTLMYRTGDLAQWLPDGNIEFLGRVDNQVKIRGFRIELGEIEKCLLEVVKETVVTVWEDDSCDKHLCAYVVLDEDVQPNELRKHLSASLPNYMIPPYFLQLDKLPLTPNGKVDRKALPRPEGGIQNEYVAPRNATEEVLAQIWSEVLDCEKVGIHNNFFDLGGHSLKGTILVAKMHKALNVEVPLRKLFATPTISEIGEYISGAKENVYVEMESIEPKDYYETSYTQKRMWILNQLHPESPAFNMSGRITFFEEVDIASMQKVFDKLAERHEAFRTRFEERDGVLVQIIDNEVALKIDVIDLTELPSEMKAKERDRSFQEQSSNIFNLKNGQLIAVKLVKIEDNEHDLILCIHHIISDGWSLEVISDEFFALYETYKSGAVSKLVPLKVQYKDFAVWQNKLIEDKTFSQEAKAFWKEQLSGEIATITLPRDYQGDDPNDKMGSSYRVFVGEGTKNILKGFAKHHRTSLFVVFLTTFMSFMSNLTKQNDILIGAAVSGREHVDLQNVVGCFINTIIFRSEINENVGFINLLKEMNEKALASLKYQRYPLELVTEELGIKYPKISVFLNMLNFKEVSEHTGVTDSKHFENVQDVKFDFEWYVIEHTNDLQIDCVYNRKLFEPSTIEYIMKKYIQFVGKISENPDKLLKDYFETEKKRRL
ncbi:MAG: amino acid adenylation domain-containing protein [Oscillospiraceae bacterium]|nr:amino acid adenylation domain-containing protein [Oscillospiraceae bacterium]